MPSKLISIVFLSLLIPCGGSLSPRVIYLVPSRNLHQRLSIRSQIRRSKPYTDANARGFIGLLLESVTHPLSVASVYTRPTTSFTSLRLAAAAAAASSSSPSARATPLPFLSLRGYYTVTSVPSFLLCFSPHPSTSISTRVARLLSTTTSPTWSTPFLTDALLASLKCRMTRH